MIAEGQDLSLIHRQETLPIYQTHSSAESRVVIRLSSEIMRQELDITSKNITKIMSLKPGQLLEMLLIFAESLSRR